MPDARKGRWLAAAAVAFVAGAGWQPFCQAQPAVEDVTERITRRAVYEAARSVVRVEWDQPSRRRTWVANGTVMTETGGVLTAGIPSQAATGRLRVIDYRKRSHSAKWIDFDERSGLTLLVVEAAQLRPPVAASRPPRPGDAVFVVRSALEPEPVKSGRFRQLEQTVEIDGQLLRRLFEFAAPLSFGDAGALLANEQGEMIGLVRGRIAHGEREPARRDDDSIGVAIPYDAALRIAELLAKQGRLQRGYLGLVVEEFADGERVEIQVVEITAGTPAERAGLKVGDVVQAIQEHEIVGMEDLMAALEGTAPGDRISLDVTRGEDQHRMDIVLGASPRPGEGRLAPRSEDGLRHPRRLGLEAQDVDSELRRHLQLHAQRGALVVRVMGGSPADRLGIRPLDVIVAADNQPVQSSADLAEAVRSGTGKTLQLRWLRGERPLEGVAMLAGRDAAAEPQAAEEFRVDPAVQQRIRALQQRIDELEAYVRELERRLEQQSDAPGASPAVPSSDPAPVTPKE